MIVSYYISNKYLFIAVIFKNLFYIHKCFTKLLCSMLVAINDFEGFWVGQLFGGRSWARLVRADLYPQWFCGQFAVGQQIKQGRKYLHAHNIERQRVKDMCLRVKSWWRNWCSLKLDFSESFVHMFKDSTGKHTQTKHEVNILQQIPK